MKATNFLKFAVVLVLLFSATNQRIFGQQDKPDYEKAMKFIKDKVTNSYTSCYSDLIGETTFDYINTNVTMATSGRGNTLTSKFSMEDFDPNRVEVKKMICNKSGQTGKDYFNVVIKVTGDKERVSEAMKFSDGEGFVNHHSWVVFGGFSDKDMADRVAKALRDAIQAAQIESPY